MNEASQPILIFLLELRKRLIYCVLTLGIIFFILFYFANPLYTFLAQPLLNHLPAHTSIIATSIVSPFLAPIKLAFILACFLTIPVFLYQVWSFVAPALYRHERRLVWLLLLSSTLLFYCGVGFAYFIVFPLVFNFITHTAPVGVMVSPDITQYLDFTLKLFFAFGAAFEMPVAIILLIWSGITTVATLRQQRPYVIVGAFVVGMLLAPPDVISQTMLAIPLWLLYEVGLVLARFFVPITK